MKTRLFAIVLLTVMLLGFGWSVPQALLSAQEADSITAIPAPEAESTAATKSVPAKESHPAEVGQGGLTLGWKQLRELLFEE